MKHSPATSQRSSSSAAPPPSSWVKIPHLALPEAEAEAQARVRGALLPRARVLVLNVVHEGARRLENPVLLLVQAPDVLRGGGYRRGGGCLRTLGGAGGGGGQPEGGDRREGGGRGRGRRLPGRGFALGAGGDTGGGY